jgi:hypothetical protein
VLKWKHVSKQQIPKLPGLKSHTQKNKGRVQEYWAILLKVACPINMHW